MKGHGNNSQLFTPTITERLQLEKIIELDTAVAEWKEKAEKAEELLLADPLVVDLRKVWDNAPDWAESVKFYYNNNIMNGASEDFISLIPRPKPAWVPVKGEAVFYNATIGVIDKSIPFVGRFIEENIDGYYAIVMTNGETHYFGKELVKPFTPENIGKRWEEI